jgi:hypothetical protein
MENRDNYDFDDVLTHESMINLIVDNDYEFRPEFLNKFIGYFYPTVKILRNLDLNETLFFNSVFATGLEQIEDLSIFKREIMKKLILEIINDIHVTIEVDYGHIENADDENMGEEYLRLYFNRYTNINTTLLNFFYLFWVDIINQDTINNIAYLASDQTPDTDANYTLRKLFNRPFFNPNYSSTTDIDTYFEELPTSGSLNGDDWTIVLRNFNEIFFNNIDIEDSYKIQWFNNFIRGFNYYQLFINQEELTQENILSRFSSYTQDNNYFTEQFLDQNYRDSYYINLWNINNSLIKKNGRIIYRGSHYSLDPETDNDITFWVNESFENAPDFLASFIIKIIAIIINNNNEEELLSVFQASSLHDVIRTIYNIIIEGIENVNIIRYIDVILSIIDHSLFQNNNIFYESFNTIRTAYITAYNFIYEEAEENPVREIIYSKNPTIKIVNIDNPECNATNDFENENDKRYPLDPVDLSRIPRKRLVAVEAGNNTRCYNAESLLNHWKSQATLNPPANASDPINRLEFDEESINYVQNLVANDISEEDLTDYYYI